MPMMRLNGVECYYEVQGEGEPIVFLHHGFGCTKMWKEIVPAAVRAGYQAVLYDRRVGASMGFLWFNTYPAQVFMGDTGSLSLGGALGTIALMTKQELLLIIVGGIFVIETLSVIIQVASYKLTGKRVFKMAPIHHHYELKGWAEPKIIVRFWIISIFLGLIAISTLKIR